MKTGDFDYHLPQELIAQTPVEPRDHSRMMVVSRADGSVKHRRFHDLPEYLKEGDVLVFNDSRVFPARLYGQRDGSGGRVELLLLSRTSPGVWRALVRPGRRMRVGAAFVVGGDEDRDKIRGEILQVEDDGTRLVRLSNEDAVPRLGLVPLPPYIHEPLADWERYQTVYARVEGSVAAPTAGLHFTPALLDRVRSMGVETVFVTLHVGWDSFRPVKGEDPTEHTMHSEYWELGREAADAINRAKAEGRRVVSVGTTAVRLLEQVAALYGGDDGPLAAGSGWADLYILPGYRFRVVDALVTNFHLPQSTLLMLTSAFAGHVLSATIIGIGADSESSESPAEGRELVLDAYRQAASRRYRFYSFGDAMLIL